MIKGVPRGKWGKLHAPETEKMVAENGGISEGSIISNKFSNKINKIKNKKIKFPLEFSLKIFKIFSEFHKNLRLSSKRAKN